MSSWFLAFVACYILKSWLWTLSLSRTVLSLSSKLIKWFMCFRFGEKTPTLLNRFWRVSCVSVAGFVHPVPHECIQDEEYQQGVTDDLRILAQFLNLKKNRVFFSLLLLTFATPKLKKLMMSAMMKKIIHRAMYPNSNLMKKANRPTNPSWTPKTWSNSSVPEMKKVDQKQNPNKPVKPRLKMLTMPPKKAITWKEKGQFFSYCFSYIYRSDICRSDI